MAVHNFINKIRLPERFKIDMRAIDIKVFYNIPAAFAHQGSLFFKIFNDIVKLVLLISKLRRIEISHCGIFKVRNQVFVEKRRLMRIKRSARNLFKYPAPKI